jgi:hypothetical protein
MVPTAAEVNLVKTSITSGMVNVVDAVIPHVALDMVRCFDDIIN